MKELHRLEDYTFSVIESFIKNSIEESIHIEFKSNGALSNKDSDKKEVSKDVSAFANSNGGIIIYGISEKNHKADSFSFINGDDFTKEWLEQIISSTVSRNISDLKIFPIRKDGDIKKSIYVVQIPSSIDAPHMSRDKRFYKRHNFESVFMEEYEVRSLYGRKVLSKLALTGYALSHDDFEEEDKEVTFTFYVYIANEGEKMESEYKINVYFKGFVDHISFFQKGFEKNHDFTLIEKNNVKISSIQRSAIYPNEQLNPFSFSFKISRDFLVSTFQKLNISIKLFYPNGEDNIDVSSEYLENKLVKLTKCKKY